MNLEQFLANLADLGIQVEVVSNRLQIQTQNGPPPPDVQEILEDFEEEILLWLESSADADRVSLQVVPDPAARFEPFPLTDIQHAYWVGRSGSFALGDVGTHIYLELACPVLDTTRLNQAWQQLVAHHDMLRAIVTTDGEQQVLAEVPNYEIAVTDMRGKTPTDVDAYIAGVREVMAAQVLPAEQWPLYELCATLLDGDETRLHISMDVLFCDLGSLFQLFSQWQALYADIDAPLPDIALSFRDYVMAEQQIETTPEYAQARDYWLERLSTLPPSPELPVAQDAANLEQTHFTRRSARLPSDVWGALKARASNQGLTPNGLLLAAFSEVLSRWSKNPRFTLNLTLFNRQPLHPEVDQLIGDFTAINLLSVDNSIAAPFSQRAQTLQQQLWADLEQRSFDGMRVIRELARQQGGAGQALMPIVFTSGLGLESGRGFQPFGKEVYSCSQTPQVWLDHIVLEEEGKLSFSWNSVDDLFPAGLMEEMFTAYCELLHQLAVDEQLWQNFHPVQMPLSQQKQRQAVNATDVPISNELLHTLFLQQVDAHADDPAVITPRRTLSYRQLYDYANTIGHWLRNKGAERNQLVAVVMEKGWEQVVAVLGIHLSGAAYLPIDPNLPSERQHYLLAQGEVSIILTQSQLDERLTWPEGSQALAIDTIGAEPNLPSLEITQKPTDLAYIIYTSGSTGLPKGVVIDHRGAVNTVLDINRRFNVTSEDRVLGLSALNFDLSVYDIFGLLAVGGAIVLPAPDLRTDPAHWYELMVRYRVTLWNTVPALMQMLVDYFGQDDTQDKTLDNGHSPHNGAAFPTFLAPASLRLVMMSGDWIPVTLPDRIKGLWNDIQVYSLGGATEASIWSIYYPIEEVDPTWSSIPYGRPMMNQSFQVLDRHLQPSSVWVPGDLYIGGIGLALGYWKDEAKSSERFIIHPESGQRLYKTGDLGRYLPDGNIEFLGREDFQVKIRGHRIELGEIEATLLQHESLREAAVNAIGDPKGNRQLVAYVVADEQQKDILFTKESVNADEHQSRWHTFSANAQRQLAQLPSEQGIEEYLNQWTSLDQLYMDGLCYAFHTLGIYQVAKESHSVAGLMTKYAIAERYQKWLLRALLVLVEGGWLEQSGETFISVRPLPLPDLATMQGFTAPLVGEASTSFLRQTAVNLADVLTERVHSAEFYAQESNIAQVYQEGFDRINHLMKDVVRTLLQETSGDLNILEVGAGYGSTTNHLLPILEAEPIHYTFTDVSDFFLQKAQQTFADYPFFSYGLLDLECDPIGQGYAAHSYNLIIAASVLHVPRDIEETLRHLRTLLAPGGLLIMIEETEFHRSYDLGMGLQQGFERFEDHELRPAHPLLSRKAWSEQLLDAGFSEVALFNQPKSITDALGIDIVVAQGPTTVQRFDEQGLHDYLAEKLPEYMVPMQTILLESLPLTANGKVDRQALPDLQAQSANKRDLVLPETATQTTVADIWTEILKVDAVGIHENFFGLGGDSLLATQALSRLRTKLEIELPLRAFLDRPTIAELATYVDVAATTMIAMPQRTSLHLQDSAALDEGKEVEEW